MKSRWELLCLIFLCCFYNLSQCLFAQTSNEVLCGPRSLLAVCSKLGVKATLEELSDLTYCNSSNGTTMNDLYEAAKKKGLHAKGMKMGIDNLLRVKLPAIAYLWPNHFVTVESVSDKTLKIGGLSEKSSTISIEQFGQVYSGFVLLVSKEDNFPQIEEKGSDIRFEKYIYDFGQIQAGEKKLTHTFQFRNAGKESLKIVKVRSSCGGCTATLLSGNTIPPGGKGQITVSFDTTGRRGFQNQNIYVHSNDPVTPIILLQIKGLIKTELTVIPNKVYLDVKKGSPSIHERIYIVKPEGEQLQIYRIETSNSILSVRLSESSHMYYKGYEIDLTLCENVHLGKIEEKILIYTNNKKQPVIEIPVICNIKGNIEVYPDMFFFGSLKHGESKKCTVTISTKGNQPLRIEKVENNVPFISINIIPGKDEREFQLVAILKKKIQVDTIKGDVTIVTNDPDQPQIKIPVYGIVQK